MATLNYAFKELSCKIVFYGCGLCGKTTNLIHIHKTVPGKSRGELVSLATEQDRTLFFDFLPLDLGEVKGFKTKFQLYTVPGQVYYNATRKLVLRGVDGLVFVADSQRDRFQENIDSLENLRQNLAEYGYRLQANETDQEGIPWVLQYNKRDAPQVASIEEMNEALNPGGIPYFEAVAITGVGVKQTLKGITSMVIKRLNREGTESGGLPKPAAPAPTAAAAAAAAAKADDEYGSIDEKELEHEGSKSGASPKAAPAQPAKQATPAAKQPAPAAPASTKPAPAAPAAPAAAAKSAAPAKPATMEADPPAAAPAAAATPSINLSQSGDARWRGMKTGSSNLTLANLVGGAKDEYQLTGVVSFLGFLRNSWSKRLKYQGQQKKVYNGTESSFHHFKTVAGQDGPELDVFVSDSGEKSLFVRYQGTGGEVNISPTGKPALS